MIDDNSKPPTIAIESKSYSEKEYGIGGNTEIDNLIYGNSVFF